MDFMCDLEPFSEVWSHLSLNGECTFFAMCSLVIVIVHITASYVCHTCNNNGNK